MSTPLIRGGQGRTAEEVKFSAFVALIAILCVILIVIG